MTENKKLEIDSHLFCSSIIVIWYHLYHRSSFYIYVRWVFDGILGLCKWKRSTKDRLWGDRMYRFRIYLRYCWDFRNAFDSNSPDYDSGDIGLSLDTKQKIILWFHLMIVYWSKHETTPRSSDYILNISESQHETFFNTWDMECSRTASR